MAGLSDVAGPSLEDQIRQRWGGYGDWQAAGQDQIAAFASLLRANGIEDLSQFNLKARNYTVPGGRQMMGGDAQEEVETPSRSGTTFDAFYGGKQLNFLGDINRDGSVTTYQPKSGDVLTKQADGSWTTPSGETQYSMLRGNDVAPDLNLLGWSSAGRGNTSFTIQKGPDGEPVVVPVWGSSRQNTYNDARAVASMVATAMGAYYAPQTGAAGQIAANSLKGYGSALAANVLSGDGDVNSMVNAGLGGQIAGGIGGGVKAIGAEYGWSPATTRAVTAGTNTLVRGGDIKDAGLSVITSGANSLADAGAITGNSTVDRALIQAGTTMARGGDANDALKSGGLSLLSGGSGSRANAESDGGSGGDGGDDPLVDGIDFGSGGGNMDDLIDPRADENGYGDFPVDPYGAGSGWGGDTLSQVGADGGTTTYRPSDNYGEGMTGEETAAFDKALAEGTLPDWLKQASAGFKTAKEFFNTPIGKTLLAAGVGKTLVNASNSLSNPVDTTRYNALFENMLSEQALASQRGKDLWADYTTIFKPAQQKFVDTAMNYDTAPRRESAAQDASGRVAASYDEQRMAAQREMERAGVDPSTIYALGVSSRLQQAKDEAGAENNARSDVEKSGLNLLSGVVNQGNTVVNQGTQQSQVATGTTQAAGGILSQQANQQNQNTQSRNAMIGDLFGAATTAYGMYASSKKTKHVDGKVDGLAAAKAVEKSPAKHWSYKKGQGDGSQKPRVGPMAEDLKREAPQVSNGKHVDGIAQLGLHHAAIGGLSKRLASIEKKLGGLSDARRG